jgi:hypothetical protein
LHEFLLSNQAAQRRKENEKSAFQENAIAAIISLYFQRNFEQCVNEKKIQQTNELKKIKADFNNLVKALEPIRRDPERYNSKETILKFIKNLMKFHFTFMGEDKKEEFLLKVTDAIFASGSANPPNQKWTPVVEALISKESNVHCKKVVQNYGILPGGKQLCLPICLADCLSVCLP